MGVTDWKRKYSPFIEQWAYLEKWLDLGWAVGMDDWGKEEMTGTEKDTEQRAGWKVHPWNCGNYKEIGQEKWGGKLLGPLLNPKTKGERTVARRSTSHVVLCDPQRTVVWNEPWGEEAPDGTRRKMLERTSGEQCPQESQVSFPVVWDVAWSLRNILGLFWCVGIVLLTSHEWTAEAKWFALCRCPSHRTALDFPVLHLSPWKRWETKDSYWSLEMNSFFWDAKHVCIILMCTPH